MILIIFCLLYPTYNFLLKFNYEELNSFLAFNCNSLVFLYNSIRFISNIYDNIFTILYYLIRFIIKFH